EEFIEKIGYKRSTLQKYGEIYNKVKPRMRIRGLSFNHHQLIAPLEELEQHEWLHRAKDNKWTVAVFRKEMKKPKLISERNKRLKILEEYADITLDYGDALELSKEQIADDTVDAIITDPPYPNSCHSSKVISPVHSTIVPCPTICSVLITSISLSIYSAFIVLKI
ncbi:unnamed protein product, partial [marine sediment metagenome]